MKEVDFLEDFHEYAKSSDQQWTREEEIELLSPLFNKSLEKWTDLDKYRIAIYFERPSAKIDDLCDLSTFTSG